MQRLGKGHSSTRYPTPVNGRTPFAYKYDYSNKQKPPLRQMSAIGGSRNPSQLKHFGKGNEFTDSLPSKYIKRPQHQCIEYIYIYIYSPICKYSRERERRER